MHHIASPLKKKQPDNQQENNALQQTNDTQQTFLLKNSSGYRRQWKTFSSLPIQINLHKSSQCKSQAGTHCTLSNHGKINLSDVF